LLIWQEVSTKQVYNTLIGILKEKKKLQERQASRRISMQAGLIVEADGIEDLDDKPHMSVKLQQNRHKANNEI
jgi:hypothetical protein